MVNQRPVKNYKQFQLKISQWQKGEDRKTSSTVKLADAWAVERVHHCKRLAIAIYSTYTVCIYSI
jgi:hypothetical protein